MKGYNPGQNGWNTLPICRSLEILLAHSLPPPHLCNVGCLMAGTFHTLYEGGRGQGEGWAGGRRRRGWEVVVWSRSGFPLRKNMMVEAWQSARVPHIIVARIVAAILSDKKEHNNNILQMDHSLNNWLMNQGTVFPLIVSLPELTNLFGLQYVMFGRMEIVLTSWNCLCHYWELSREPLEDLFWIVLSDDGHGAKD